jgi:hypothetical protein
MNMFMQRTVFIVASTIALSHLVSCANHSPYAGMQARDIKALSANDIEGLRAGRGMSMALPAELNGYPGPLHVLQHQEALGLSASQRAATQDLFDRMKQDAIAAGESYVRAERELDRLFARKTRWAKP